MEDYIELEQCEYCGEDHELNKGFCSDDCWNGYKNESFKDQSYGRYRLEFYKWVNTSISIHGCSTMVILMLFSIYVYVKRYNCYIILFNYKDFEINFHYLYY